MTNKTVSMNLLPGEISKNRENIQLIWLDGKMSDISDFRLTKSMLMELNSSIQFYSDLQRCVNFIKSIPTEQIFLIVSGALVRELFSQLKNHSSLLTIFIFCVHSEYHQHLLDKHDEIVGIYTRQTDLLTSIRTKLNLLIKQTIAFNLFDQKQNSMKDLSKDSASFLWHQMLIFVLKQIPQDEQSKQQMINLCLEYYHNNKHELQKIAEFQTTYQSNLAIQWYTDECFLYKLINKALRTEDLELLYTFRFFIIDLCHAIEKKSMKLKSQEQMKVYRGTRISDDELDKFRNNIGQIISTNGFFSTSKNEQISIEFAKTNVIKKGFQSVLFEMHLDLSKKSISCIDISLESLFDNEEEVLFNLNSTFQIHSVEFDSKLKLWKIHLHNTDEGIDRMEEYLTLAKQNLEHSSAMIYFGCLLWKDLGLIHRAKKYFSMLLESLPNDHSDIHAIYNNLGNIYREEHEYNLALKNYQIAYEIRKKQFPTHHSFISASFGNIGLTYRMKGEYDLALEYYQKTYEIDELNHQGDHISKAMVLDNMGLVYSDRGEFEQALEYQKRALKMFKHVLPKEHHDIARCLGHIGFTYERQENYVHALKTFQKVLKMQDKSLPFDHPNLGFTFDRIISMHLKLNQFQQAFEFCQEKLQEQIHRLGKKHIAIARTLNTMGNALNESDCEKAMNYYQQAFDIFENASPIDHLAAIACLKSMGSTYGQHGHTEQAMKMYFKALDLSREYLSSEHIDIAEICIAIAYGYEILENFNETIDYYNQSLVIYRANYGSNDRIVQQIEEEIERLTKLKDDEHVYF